MVHLVALLTVDTALDVSSDFVGHNLWFIGVFVALTAVHLSVFTGGRMPPVAAVAVVVTVFVVATLAVAIHLKVPGLPHGRLSAVIALTVLALVWSALVVWHFAQRAAYADVAWNGAGASVVLAAAVWVALLFTTGVVTGAANYLNGPDHGVADLISTSDTTARAAALGAPATARGSHGAGVGIDRFTATGDVTADHAIVTVDGSRIVVVSGSLTMTSSSSRRPRPTRLPGAASPARSTAPASTAPCCSCRSRCSGSPTAASATPTSPTTRTRPPRTSPAPPRTTTSSRPVRCRSPGAASSCSRRTPP